MLTVNRYYFDLAGRYLLMFGLAFVLKQFYSSASAAQLQWILYPLVILLEVFSDLHFEPTPSNGWLDSEHQVSIVKACAGMNFMIISLLAFLWKRNQPPSIQQLVYAFLSAWPTALCANTLRILICVYGQSELANLAGLSEDDTHRLIGIAVYFVCLWAQLSAFRLHNFRCTGFRALVLYLGITLLIPALRAWLTGAELPPLNYTIWVVGGPVLLVLMINIYGMKRREKPVQFR
ncbi:MAG: exosortase K [Gammaproteobacteria bacterium]